MSRKLYEMAFKKRKSHTFFLRMLLSSCHCPSLSLPKPCKLLFMYIIVIISRKSIQLLVLISSDTFSASPFSSSLHPLQIVISKGIIIVITWRKLTKIPWQFHASELLYRFHTHTKKKDYATSVQYLLFLNDYSRNTNQKCLPPEQHYGFNISCCFFEWGCPIFHQRNTSPISLSLKTAIMCKCLLIYLSQGHWPVWVTTIYC